MARHSKDSIELFHDYGIYTPTRTILMESSTGDGGEDDGVNYAMSTFFMKNFHILESSSSEPITVIMNTVGGDIWQGMAIYDMIKASKCHVTIKVFGMAASMGSIILQSADARLLAPSACVMFHLGTPDATGNNIYEMINASQYELEFGKRLDKLIFDRIKEKRDKENLAFTAQRFQDMNFKSKYMSAQEAVDLGLADGILESN